MLTIWSQGTKFFFKWATYLTSFRLAGNWREALHYCTLIFTIETFRIFTLVEITSCVSHMLGSYYLQRKISLLVCTLNITKDFSFQTKNDPRYCKRNLCNYLRSLKNYCSFKYFPVFSLIGSNPPANFHSQPWLTIFGKYGIDLMIYFSNTQSQPYLSAAAWQPSCFGISEVKKKVIRRRNSRIAD